MYLCKKAVGLAEKPEATIYCKLRGSMAWSWLEVNRILEAAGLFLVEQEVADFKEAGRMFLMSLQKLANVEPKQMWKLRPKHHQLDHMIDEMGVLSYLNPKKITCLAEEDYLGKMKTISKPCRGGNPIAMMGRVTDRYLLSIGMRWHRRKKSQTWDIRVR